MNRKDVIVSSPRQQKNNSKGMNMNEMTKGNKPLWIKIVADKKTGRVLGSQIVGGEGVKERIDLMSLALLLKANITDLANYDACYVPPSCPLWEPVNIAASQIAKKL